MNRLRILIVGPNRHTALQRPLNWISQAGHQVCLVDNSCWRPESLPDGCRFEALEPPGLADLLESGGERPERQEAEQAAARLLARTARRFAPDVAHLFGFGYRARVVALAGLRPLVVSAWGYLNRLLTEDPRQADLPTARRVLTSTDTLIVDAPNLVGPSHAFAGHALRVEVLPLGPDTALFHPDDEAKRAAWRFALQIPDDAVVLLSPRGWSPLYGHHHIVDAFARARGHLQRPAFLAFLAMGRGRDGPSFFEEVRDQAARLGLDEAIRWLPEVSYDQMPGLYAMADVIVNYPSTDTLSSTLLEAAACRRPVITADLPGYEGTFIRELFDLVPPDDPRALADAVVVAVNREPREVEERLDTARDAVLKDYPETRDRRQLLALYHELSTSPSPGPTPLPQSRPVI